MNKSMICCFCGNAVVLKEAAVVTIRPSIESEETQDFFCHKEHLIENLDVSIVKYLHPDFF